MRKPDLSILAQAIMLAKSGKRYHTYLAKMETVFFCRTKDGSWRRCTKRHSKAKPYWQVATFNSKVMQFYNQLSH